MIRLELRAGIAHPTVQVVSLHVTDVRVPLVGGFVRWVEEAVRVWVVVFVGGEVHLVLVLLVVHVGDEEGEEKE